MLQKIQNNLSKIDIFGSQVSLSFRDQDIYRTSFGGFISICILATIISFFYSNIISFFAMTTVTSQTFEIFDDNPSLLTLNYQDFMYALGIQQTNFTTRPWFNITVEQRHYQRFPNGTQIKHDSIFIDMTPCTYDHFDRIFTKYGQNFSETYNLNALDNYLCPNLSDPNSQTIYIGGTYNSEHFYFMRIYVKGCSNNTATSSLSWKPTCSPRSEIDDIIENRGNFRVQLWTVNYIVNPNQPSDYIVPYLGTDQQYTFTPDKTYVQSDIYFRTKNIITDRGILMYSDQSEQDINYRQYMDNKDQVLIGQNYNEQYAVFFFNRSPYSYKITRNFLRLDELLSYLGGFVQFMLVVIGVFVVLYNKHHMVISIANDLYQFKKEQEKYSIRIQDSSLNQTDNKMIKKKSTTIEQLGENRSLKAFKWKQEHNNEISRQSSAKKLKSFDWKTRKFEYFDQFKQFMSEKLQIKFNFRMLLSYIFPIEGLMNDETILLKKGIDQINKELDLKYILSKLQEINKLKQVLFTDEQITLFNFSQKPMIMLNKGTQSSKSIILYGVKEIDENSQEQIDQLTQFQQLVMSYQQILNTDEQSLTEEQLRFNYRLISILGNQLCNILNKEIADCFDQSYEPNPDADED